MRRSKAVLLVLVVAVAAPAGGRAAPAVAGWSAKIDPALLGAGAGRLVRYVVELAEDADLSGARSVATLDERRAAVVDTRRTTAERSQRGLRRLLAAARAAGSVADFHPYWITNAIGVQSTAGVMRAIAARPEVARIAADHRRRLLAGPSVAEATPGWNITTVGAPAAWDVGIDGTGAVVASIDTGVDVGHPSVASKYRGADGNEDFAWWDAINHEQDAYDDNAHGTHTMGTMVGGDASGPDPDDIGVAPGATFIAAKAFDAFGGGFDTWILEAAEYLTAPTRADGSDPRPELAPDVVNNSWGGGQCDGWFDEVLETWRAMDIFPAFAIGNSGPGVSSTGSPGDRAGAFAVGATTIDDEVADFSSRGPSCDEEVKPEVSAPGQGVRSSVPGGGFEEFDGTSMATPHIAGAVALLTQAAVGSLAVDELESVLAETALDLGETGPDNDFGAGRLQAFDAVSLAATGGLVEGVVTDGTDPVPGSTITFTGSERTVRVRSKADGSYRARLLEGAHLATVSAFGYLPASATVAIVEQETTVQDFTLVLAPIHTVSGSVTEGPSGAPLAGATVEVPGTPLAPVTTDAAGLYAIDVPAGEYGFTVTAGGCRVPASEPVNALAGATVHDFVLERKLDAFGHVCDEVPFVLEPGAQKLPLSGYAASEEVALPFTFPFYGYDLDAVWVSTSGYVSTTESAEVANIAIPGAAEPNGAIFALWDELSVRGSARGVYTATYGAEPARRFVVEYRNFEVAETGDLLNFSIVLFEDGDIELRYRSLEGTGNGASATVGIEDPSGSVALGYSFERPVLGDATAVRFALGPFGRLAGTITSAADGLPIEGATITAGGRSARSAADGGYQLSAFPGAYDVTVSAEGYESQAAVATFADGVTTPLDAALDAPRIDAPAEIVLSTAGGIVEAPLQIANGGTRPLAYALGERPGGGALSRLVTDPAGDAATVDITEIEGGVAGGLLDMRLGFSEGTDLGELGGYVLLDVDQDPATGSPPENQYGSPAQDVGYEYFVDVWDAATFESVSVWSDDYDYLGQVPAAVDDAGFRFQVPLEMLDGDDGEINFAAIVGDYFEPTDWAPDAGHGVVGVSIDVPWLSVEGVDGALVPGSSDDMVVRVDPAGLGTGEHVAQVLYLSNDPRRPVARTVVRVTVDDQVAPSSTIDAGIAGAVVRPLVRVKGTATDAIAGVSGVVVTFTNAVTGSTESADAGLDCGEGPPLTCTWMTPGPALPGVYAVTATATDLAGNVQDPPATAQLIIV